jgi:hypothetical protein
MEQIVIRVKDKQKAQALANFLQTLDFVETVTGTAAGIEKKASEPRRVISSLWPAYGQGGRHHWNRSGKKPGPSGYDPLRYEHPY